jgi:outer membrane protein assembly factor BamD
MMGRRKISVRSTELVGDAVRYMGLILVACLAVTGCKSGGGEDPIMRLSAEEAFEQGKSLLENKKYRQAVEYLEHAFEIAPNSVTGREALLLAADSLYLDGGTANYIKAEAKYRDFQNRFPTSERADYVQLQIANCLTEQVLKPDRDQSATRKALVAFDDLLRVYPTSESAGQAQPGIVDLRRRLADHEYMVGRYNYKRRLYAAAESRFSTMLQDYPEYMEQDKVLYMLGRSQMKQKHAGEAEETFFRLEKEHPDSRFIGKIPKLPDIPPEVEEPAEVVDEEPADSAEEDSGAEEDS